MANTAGLIDIKLRAGFDKGAMNTAQREVGKNMQLMANRSKQAGMAINSTIAMSILPFGAALAGAFGFGAAAAVKFEDVNIVTKLPVLPENNPLVTVSC